MSTVARECVGGPYNNEMRVVSENAVSIIVPHPEAQEKRFCKYELFGEDLCFVALGTKQELAEKTLDSSY